MEALLRQYCEDAGYALGASEVRQLAGYGSMIAKWNRITNLVADATPRAVVTDHIGDCLAAVPHIHGDHIVDVGSGAGLPGVVIAILRPQSRLTLLESRQRKARFLRQVAIDLGLNNIAVAAERVQSWRPDGTVDSVVCRGYSSLAKFCADTIVLHHPALRLYALKGVLRDEELSAIPQTMSLEEVLPLRASGWTHRHLVVLQPRGG